MSKTSKVHGPYYLEYKDWSSGGYYPIRDSNTSGYATKYKTITEARKKAVAYMRRNSCQLVGIYGGVGRTKVGSDGRPIIQGGTAGIVRRKDYDFFTYDDYNSGNTYRINKDGSVKKME